MKRWLGIALGALCIVLAAFLWLYAPRRAVRLSRQYAEFRESFQPAHDAIDAGFNHRYRTVNGIRWHYVDQGASDGEVILFLHGLPEGWYSWRYVLPLVNRKYRLIAIDMKGYGRSDREDRDYNWHRVAQQTADLMDSLGIRKYYVVSHDWGSIIGSVLVSDHPDRIRGFVRMEADLIQSKGIGKIATYFQKPQWVIFRSHWIASYMMQDPGWFIDTVYRSRMTIPFRQTDRDYLVYEFLTPRRSRYGFTIFPERELGSGCRARERSAPIHFRSPYFSCKPTAIPAQPPSIFADAATKCPNVKIEWMTNASHFDNFDQPADVANAINHFVN